MTNAEILEILKFGGFALTAVSAVWGLTQRTTFDDVDGRRRLTPAGYLAALLFVGSALIGASAFGFETLAKDAERKAQADEAQSARLDQARRDMVSLQAELRRRAEAAELRAAAADQRALTLQSEADQRRRDLEIARNVSRGSAANLAQARVTLGQVHRLLNPLGDIQVSVTFLADVSAIDSPALRQLRALAAEAERDPNVYESARVSWRPVGPRPFPIRSVGVTRDSPYFPREDDPLAIAILRASVDFNITLNGSQLAQENRETIAAGVYPLSWDLAFDASATTVESIRLVLPSAIEFTVEATIASREVNRTGNIASVSDLENANLIITWYPHPGRSRRNLPPGYDLSLENARLVFGGRIFDFEGNVFRKEDIGPWDRKHFILESMGRSIF